MKHSYTLVHRLAVVGIAALATAILIFWRRRGAESSASVGIVPVLPFAGPIARLSFSESLDPVRFAEAAEEEARARQGPFAGPDC